MASVQIRGIHKYFGATADPALTLGYVSQNASFKAPSISTSTNASNPAVRQMHCAA